ncbi:hypothetical protein PINS_up001977 [Pythium insidiosum]|nr:hypothetical protein PINS_up001977 [Pythium insidiosum]
MPIDATTRHVFAYGGSSLQMADEHTVVFASGNALQFMSTISHSQHFLPRNKPRRLLRFDINWANSELVVTTREPSPEILIYSYPDKKLRGKLQHPPQQQQQQQHGAAAVEYAMLKYSRCGRRLVSVSAEELPANEPEKDGTRMRRLSVWNMERQEALSGCASIPLAMDVAFVSFDPCNYDHILLGGDGGLHVWKIYKGRASFVLRQVIVKLKRWTTVAGASSQNSLKAHAARVGRRHFDRIRSRSRREATAVCLSRVDAERTRAPGQSRGRARPCGHDRDVRGQ